MLGVLTRKTANQLPCREWDEWKLMTVGRHNDLIRNFMSVKEEE
jgi:hypothetical protein